MHQRLSALELPKYKDDIAREERRAEHELREHVLHRLREQILIGKTQLERINDALGKLDFRGERYRFRWVPDDDLHEFYRVLMDACDLGSGSLFENAYYS